MAAKESKRKKVTEQRREQILKAAAEVFTGKGYAAATIPEIAKEAKVAAGTIYLYYPGKRALFVAVVKDMIITPPLLDLLSQMPVGDYSDILKSILKNRFDLIKNPSFSRVPFIMGEVQRDPELKALWLQDFLHPLLEQIEMLVRMMGTTGKFREIQPEVLVRVMGGLFMGFMLLKIMEGDTSPLNKLDQDKVADDIAGFIMHGVLNNPKGER
jgi:TetR/AcrR family transcriptional regulator, regulator of autoinduction and epiphytic fitness